MKAKSWYLALVLAIVVMLPAGRVEASEASSVIVNVAPENPAPGESVEITLNSYLNNLDSILISWSANGKNSISGIGKKSFTLSAPDAGVEVRVVATLELPSGNVEKKILIRPNVMTLLWQAADSYVPPFYRGKALPTADSEVRVVAMPEVKDGGKMVSPKNMTFSWKQDYENEEGTSGYGKNSFLYTNDYLEDSNNIGVTASTIDGKYSTQANIDIGMVEPKLLFYKTDRKLGTVWERALAASHAIEGEETIVAAPYFISPKELRHPFLVWTWLINGAQVSADEYRKNILPVRTDEGVSGTSSIRLNIENREKLFQSVSREMYIEF